MQTISQQFNFLGIRDDNRDQNIHLAKSPVNGAGNTVQQKHAFRC